MGPPPPTTNSRWADRGDSGGYGGGGGSYGGGRYSSFVIVLACSINAFTLAEAVHARLCIAYVDLQYTSVSLSFKAYCIDAVSCQYSSVAAQSVVPRLIIAVRLLAFFLVVQ
jgi:hypothetical protein